MAKLEFSVDVAAPPDRVFAFFVPQRMPYWYGAEMAGSFEIQDGAEEFAAGLKVRIVGRVGRKEISHTVVVTRYEWGRVLEWQFRDAYGVRGLQCWELEPSPVGTLVRLRDEYQMPGWLGRLADRLFTRRAVARRDLRELARLRKLAEQK